MGQLQRCLARGEYGRLRECPLFESDFLQVTKSGDVASRVTLGIAATSRRLELPDLLLLARPVPPPVGAPAAAAAPRGCPPRGRSSSSLGCCPCSSCDSPSMTSSGTGSRCVWPQAGPSTCSSWRRRPSWSESSGSGCDCCTACASTSPGWGQVTFKPLVEEERLQGRAPPETRRTGLGVGGDLSPPP
ncbi:Golgi-associated RAB2 interactor protein 5A isoform X1 [Emydura macquarii macquarii]|uniref:Golgi-associated RAB2 interactor protein 5A isoform X1 n=1 Tax=Emydura macquarii macquarii TaxID=1129001 RepID=UPI00352AEA57